MLHELVKPTLSELQSMYACHETKPSIMVEMHKSCDVNDKMLFNFLLPTGKKTLETLESLSAFFDDLPPDDQSGSNAGEANYWLTQQDIARVGREIYGWTNRHEGPDGAEGRTVSVAMEQCLFCCIYFKTGVS